MRFLWRIFMYFCTCASSSQYLIKILQIILQTYPIFLRGKIIDNIIVFLSKFRSTYGGFWPFFESWLASLFEFHDISCSTFNTTYQLLLIINAIVLGRKIRFLGYFWKFRVAFLIMPWCVNTMRAVIGIVTQHTMSLSILAYFVTGLADSRSH